MVADFDHIVLLSGRICTGKTTLAKDLAAKYKVELISTSTILKHLGNSKNIPAERRALQEFGQTLDTKTGGGWVYSGFQDIIKQRQEKPQLVIIDSVRIQKQIIQFRKAFGSRVVHIHLDAKEKTLEKRYKERPANQSSVKEMSSFKEASNNATEQGVIQLQEHADVVVYTDQCTSADVLIRVACHLDFHGRQYHRNTDVLVGGQYGSEGKGQIAAHLAREYNVLVRVGGPNAGHKVFKRPDPVTFHQLPSGTLDNPNAQLVLAPGSAIDVRTLLNEIATCEVDSSRLTIDPMAIIISAKDRADEASLQKRISSTARGVGRAAVRRLQRLPKTIFAKDVKALKPYVRDSMTVLEKSFVGEERVMIEGTQGTGLSIYHGSYPYVTSRDTTVAGCLAEAGVSPSRINKVIMVCRTFPIRVANPPGGSSGPMSVEIDWKEVSRRSGTPHAKLKQTERTSTTNRERRVGEFDWTLLRKSALLNAPTDIALTFVDYLCKKNANARRFEQLTADTIWFIEEIERIACAPVSLISIGFHDRAIIDRRSW